MSDHDDALYLAHIEEAANRIERSAARRGREALGSDEDLRDATIYRLQTSAESTQRLSAELKASHPQIPWDDIAGFRNRVVHGYLGVNLDVVWDIIERDLPGLARMQPARTSNRSTGPTVIRYGLATASAAAAIGILVIVANGGYASFVHSIQ